VVTEATVDKVDSQKVSLKDIAKFAELKREKAKVKGKVDETLPKLKIKPPKLSEAGEMKMAFSKPIVVFGNGKMPDGDMLQIKVIKAYDGLDKKRRLSLDAPHVE
jgi:hypothetical protein